MDIYENHKQAVIDAISASDAAKRRISDLAKEKTDVENAMVTFRAECAAQQEEKCRREYEYVTLQRAIKEASRKAAVDLKSAVRDEKEAIIRLTKHPKPHAPYET